MFCCLDGKLENMSPANLLMGDQGFLIKEGIIEIDFALAVNHEQKIPKYFI